MYVYMRTINVTFEDGEFKKLEKVKEELSNHRQLKKEKKREQEPIR